MSPDQSTGDVAILMYHSVSAHAGPTAIAPDLFAAQMNALHEAGARVASLGEFVEWRKNALNLPQGTVVLTFDDAFADFADAAAPVLARFGWSATVFVPTACVGEQVEWGGVGESQPVLGWSDIRDLTAAGFEFGSHAQTHTDLTTLPVAAAREEIVASKARLESELQRPARHFAAPYGSTNASIRAEIARCYDDNVGTRLGRAASDCDLYDAPRIEMHYFRDLARWREFLRGGEVYLSMRRMLRSIRRNVAHLRK